MSFLITKIYLSIHVAYEVIIAQFLYSFDSRNMLVTGQMPLYTSHLKSSKALKVVGDLLFYFTDTGIFGTHKVLFCAE